VIDTAVNYRDGASEEIVGEVRAGRRDRFVLCTKYGVSPDRADPNAAGAHPENLRLSLQTGLRRLDQLQDNLQALNVRLPAEVAARLEASTGFETGFPHDFIADMQTFAFGEVASHDHATSCHFGSSL
jgi:aryl-alcohol dehydrogenase-like predicted oxidoreductase